MLRRMVFYIITAPVFLLSVSFFYRPTLIVSEASAKSVVRFRSVPDSPDPNRVLLLVNQERAKQGLQLLFANTELEILAQQRADDMATRGYYAHRNLEGKIFEDVLAEKNLYISYGCENLDLQRTSIEETYVQDWMASSAGHQQCVLSDKSTEAGYAVARMEVASDNPLAYFYVIVAIHASTPYR